MNEQAAETLRDYRVEGMSCEHCRLAVAGEVGRIRGVHDVVVDLADGRVEVRGAGFSDDEVAEAVAEAGYRVVR